MLTILPPSFRLALAIAGAVLLVVGFALRRRVGLRSPATLALLGGAACLVTAGLELTVGAWMSSRVGSGDFDEARWLLSGPWGNSASVVALAGAAAVVVLSWLATARIASPVARATLIGLRSGATFAALCLFFQPSVELRQVTREPNRLAILIDDSESMSLSERADGPSRLDRARSVIENSAATFERWRDRHRVDTYRFAEAASPTDPSLATLKGAGKATLIRRALEDIRARYRGRDLAGVVLVSDGVATGELAGEPSGEIQAFLRSIDAPVHTVLAAPPGLVDVAVSEVFADEFAFVRTVFSIEATIRSTGMKAKRLKVTLSGEGTAMRSKWIDIPEGDGETKVSFELTPSKLGRYVYEISVPVVDNEVVKSNNRRPFVVRVIRDKIRVLQVAGQPSWDVRALRGMLKQNPNVDLISFFILRTDRNISAAANNELSLIKFPTRELFLEELPSFDLVVLQNFNFGPYGIAPYLDNIRSYVEKGGALAVLGGPLSFASGGYTGTPIDSALPVSLPGIGTPAAALLDTAKFRPKLSAAGRAHPITALRHASGDNQKEWSALPELQGINRVRGLRKGSVALAVHPREKSADGKPAPIIVTGQYGDGRTLAVMTDTLWKWSFVDAQTRGSDGRSYLKFWENATRWLLDDPDFRYLRVEADRVSYEPGQAARLDIRLLARDYQPTKGNVKLKLSRGANPNTAVALSETEIQTDERGRASFEVAELEPGVYRAHASADVEGYAAEARDVFVVAEASAELDHPAAKPAVLESLASLTGGQYLGVATELPEDLQLGEPRIVRVDSRSELELWSMPWWLFVALLFLGIEWLLRQKWGYR